MVHEKDVLSEKEFIIRSWTWGLLMSLIGLIAVSAIMLYRAICKKPCELKKYGYCYCLQVGKRWGGINLGYFFICDGSGSKSTIWHEHGHAVQNCYWGILMPFVIGLPSLIRANYRQIKYKNTTPPTRYDSIWFEHDATLTGRKYRAKLEKK